MINGDVFPLLPRISQDFYIRRSWNSLLYYIIIVKCVLRPDRFIRILSSKEEDGGRGEKGGMGRKAGVMEETY